MSGLPNHQQTSWNNPIVPTGKHRGNSGGSAWLASSKSYSQASINPVKLSKLKKLVAKHWPFEGASSRSRRRLSISIDRPTAASTTRFMLLCSLWYLSSALSSNTGKAILTQFRYPVTLTFIQFGFVAFYCLILMSPVVQFSRLRTPTLAIVRSTLPMGMFQVGGHMFSSMAISRVPVSTVHTIKALSPLFTVTAYALLFGVSYSPKTYLSLLPLTLGVMLATTFDMSASNTTGLLCAFGSALIFVSSNIFFKKIMPSPTNSNAHLQSAHKLDKLNLLFYSSSMAFMLMIPMWLYYDLPIFLAPPERITHPAHHAAAHSVTYYLFMNGTVHFAQNIIAFIILSSTSPVTYSIASLIKRVAVICIAIMWFNQSVHPIQGAGILLTFFGLWMYNNAKGDVEKGENKMRRVEAARDLMLPSTNAEEKMMSGRDSPVPGMASNQTGIATAYGRSRAMSTAAQRSPMHHTNGPSFPHPPPAHVHGTAPHVKVTPPSAPTSISIPKYGDVSPLDSYPSPPPSLDDSPPSYPVDLPHAHARAMYEARMQPTRVSVQ
ncbi:TPT-domain-containing protein [Athelia psychrophila]|uniref:TPT-domain-containing protein n=1 Tax=Athelia psychrophila TaxID=1759441 RepID=A0A166JPL6_9AGAM|nr:TPT-domain-containing protein [Fibularhizoctonia sp. CBS 109695]